MNKYESRQAVKMVSYAEKLFYELVIKNITTHSTANDIKATQENEFVQPCKRMKQKLIEFRMLVSYFYSIV